MPKNQQSKSSNNRIKRVVEEFVIETTNEMFWERVFEIEKLANMNLREGEAFVIILKNPQTGEEKRYENIRLKSSMRVQN